MSAPSLELLEHLTSDARVRALELAASFSAIGDAGDAARAERWLAAIGSFAHEGVRSLMNDIERRVLASPAVGPHDTPERSRTRSMGVAIYLTTCALYGFVGSLIRDIENEMRFRPTEKDHIDSLAALLAEPASWKEGEMPG